MARIEITREQYEALKGASNVTLDMEATYWMEVATPTDTARKKKRRKPTNRRDPNALLRLTVNARDRKLPSQTQEQARAMVRAHMVGPNAVMAGKELGKELGRSLATTQDMGSYYVTQLLKNKVLEVVTHDQG